MTVDEIQSLVFDSDEKDFIRHRLFGPDCWLFDQQDLIGPTATYQGFRNSVADLIDINPNEVSLVGSAKFGVSMSPTKAWRKFDFKKSDLDCAIISENLFREVLSQIRYAYFEGYSHLMGAHSSQVFAGHIVLSSAQGYRSRYLRDAVKKISNLQRVVSENLRFEPNVNYRIYESFRVAEAYHIESLNKLKRQEGRA